MKKMLVFIFASAILYSCGNNQLPTDYLGSYHGVQLSYFMKNQYGDDFLINGQKLLVPSIDNKFLFEENNVAKLQQTNLEDNSRVYYEGNYTIISDVNGIYKLNCKVSESGGSSPSYLITINKDKTAICQQEGKTGEPELNLKKIK